MNAPETIPSTPRGLVLAAKVLVALCCALGAALFVGVAVDSQLRSDGSTRIDHAILVRVVDGRTAALTTSWKTVTWLGSSVTVIPLTILVVLLLLRSRHRILALYLALAVAGGALLNAIAKHVLGRPRPPLSLQLQHASGSSFPSGHTTQATATYLALAIVVGILASSQGRRTAVWAIAAIACVAVGLSRIYLGVHWATDVLAGWLLGAVWISALTLVFNRELRAADRLVVIGNHQSRPRRVRVRASGSPSARPQNLPFAHSCLNSRCPCGP
jgi:membrane-associated phospholipid phosphatase